MPDKSRAEGLEEPRFSKRFPPSESGHANGLDVPGSDDPEEALRQAREQIAKLDRLNKTLARNAHRADQLLQRHESALALVYELGSDLNFRLGKDGKIRFLSAAGALILGKEAVQLEGRPFVDLIPSEDRSRVRGFLQEIMRADKIESTRLRLKTGPEQYVEMDCFFRTVPHPQTGSPELLLLARPVQPGAAKDDARLGELGARLAHELSQPLTAISTTSRICARHLHELLGTDHEITIATEQMAEQSERANEMIRRLRQLSTGGTPHRSSVDLNHLLDETVNSLASPIRQAKVPMVLDLAPDLPLVQADRIQLEQVLLNLIRNALEAMSDTPANARQLTLRTRAGEGEIEVSVSDTGAGISVPLVEKLFQPYHTTKPHGMGLGLALCRSILQAPPGRLWVKGNQPRGTTFLFALPINS